MTTTINPTTDTNTSPLAQSCMLVQLTISVWQGRKLDRKVSEEVASNHGTNRNAGNYNKRLLPADAPSYEKIKTMANSIRSYFYAHTLPWSDGGSRILSGSHYMEFADSIRPMIRQFEDAVREFITDYPTLRQAAKEELNGLFREDDYPNEQTIESKFGVSLSMMPITASSNDFRFHLTENEIKLLEENMKQGIGNAMRNAYEQLHSALSAMSEKLNSPDAIFRDSLFNNLQELTQILPNLNLTNDPALVAMTDDIKSKILTHSPDTARKDKEARKTLAEESARLANAMKCFTL